MYSIQDITTTVTTLGVSYLLSAPYLEPEFRTTSDLAVVARGVAGIGRRKSRVRSYYKDTRSKATSRTTVVIQYDISVHKLNRIVTHMKKSQEPPASTWMLRIWFTYLDSKSSQEPGLTLSSPSLPWKLGSVHQCTCASGELG